MNNANQVEMSDVQGLVLRGYNYPYIRYLILSIKDTAGARKFCADLASGSGKGGMSVTNADVWEGAKPDYCLNIGFTYSGMEMLLGTANSKTVALWSSLQVFGAFKKGAVADAAAIGDTGDSAPAKWWKNGGWIAENGENSNDDSDLHIQITLFTLTQDNREKYYDILLDMITATASGPSIVPVYYQDSDPIIVDEDPNYIHFGYKDSLSQPRIDNVLWENKNVRRRMGVSTIDDRPKVPADRFVISQDASDYKAHPLLTNGTFAAFRLLYQDVAGFEKFINSGGEASAELIAAKMCGRWRDGTPLVVSPDKEDKDLGIAGPKNFNFTNFNYLVPSPNQQGDDPVSDDQGLRCPYASHIRRANPRDDINVTGNDDNAEKHRIVRRASPYGPLYDPSEKSDVEVQRGLVGLFIGAVLGQQFRFVTINWFEANGFRNPDLSPNHSGIDPLFGPQDADPDPANDKEFAYNDNGVYKVIPKLTRFVRTDGSLYLFLPGIKGLLHLSEGTIPPRI